MKTDYGNFLVYKTKPDSTLLSPVCFLLREVLKEINHTGRTFIQITQAWRRVLSTVMPPYATRGRANISICLTGHTFLLSSPPTPQKSHAPPPPTLVYPSPHIGPVYVMIRLINLLLRFLNLHKTVCYGVCVCACVSLYLSKSEKIR